MDFNYSSPPSADTSPGGLLFARIIGSAFLLVWIAIPFYIARTVASMGGPGFFSFIGYAFSIIGVLLLIRLLTWKPGRNPAASAAGSHHGPAVIHQHFAAPAPLPPPVPTVCDACGARRVARETTCRYCGGALL